MAGRHGQATASRPRHRRVALERMQDPGTRHRGASVERATKRATKPRRGPVDNRATYKSCTVVHATLEGPIARGRTPVARWLHVGSLRDRVRKLSKKKSRG